MMKTERPHRSNGSRRWNEYCTPGCTNRRMLYIFFLPAWLSCVCVSSGQYSPSSCWSEMMARGLLPCSIIIISQLCWVWTMDTQRRKTNVVHFIIPLPAAKKKNKDINIFFPFRHSLTAVIMTGDRIAYRAGDGGPPRTTLMDTKY